ncbi:MAG: hypothetical protein AB7V32_10090 [Candidatus Berkiella sp.]
MLNAPQQPPQNPDLIRFTQETISPTLSKPKPGETKAQHLDALAALISNGTQAMTDFPACEVFGIVDKSTNEVVWYSLNNRKLYLAKKSHATVMNTKLATFDEIAGDTWKMTSTSDGLSFPKLTSQNDKESQPSGLLAQFRDFVQIRNMLFPLNVRQDVPETPPEKLKRVTTEEFGLICKR